MGSNRYLSTSMIALIVCVLTAAVPAVNAQSVNGGEQRYAQNSYGNRGDRNRTDTRAEPGLVLYSRPGYTGRNVALDQDMRDLEGIGFEGRTSSLRVNWGTWEVCEQPNFRGRCA